MKTSLKSPAANSPDTLSFSALIGPSQHTKAVKLHWMEESKTVVSDLKGLGMSHPLR